MRSLLDRRRTPPPAPFTAVHDTRLEPGAAQIDTVTGRLAFLEQTDATRVVITLLDDRFAIGMPIATVEWLSDRFRRLSAAEADAYLEHPNQQREAR